MCWWSLPLEILRISRTLPVSACARPYMVNFSVISECITVQGWVLGFFGGRGGGVLVLPVQSLSESNLENQICHFSEKKKIKSIAHKILGNPFSRKHTYIIYFLDYVAQLSAMPTFSTETLSWLPNSLLTSVVPLPPTFQLILPT